MSISIDALKKAIELEKASLDHYQDAIKNTDHKESIETLEKITADKNQQIDALHWLIMAEAGNVEGTESTPQENGAEKLSGGKCPFSKGELEKMGFDMTNSTLKD
ncbi:MAG: hypothetical protein ACQ9MH_04915 [Nitrospinales bacterium]